MEIYTSCPSSVMTSSWGRHSRLPRRGMKLA